ncbi:MAG: hypothetical protein HRT40_01850 [Campylobacteraceae bacterium]|nr:hypothetical protein [Campylobacteraceae bacterium]
MKKILGTISLFIIVLLSGCASSGYSIKDYQNANIAKDGLYEFNNPRIEKSNLLIRITTFKDTKTGKNKKKFIMLTVNKDSKNYDFNENDKNVIEWPYYYIDKQNRVSTRIYEKGTFNELKHNHPYFISGSSYEGQMGFRYRLDFTEAKFIK